MNRLNMAAAKRFKRAGSMIRTNMPTVTANYQMQPQDKGCIIGAPGITVTLPPYQDAQQGEDYDVVSLAGGAANVATSMSSGGSQESILALLGGVKTQIATDTIPAGITYVYARESDTFSWVRSQALGPMGPQGIQGFGGPMGPQGPQGTVGPKGDTGLVGATGATGPTGPKGDVGAIGAVGPSGTQGLTGSTGPSGPKGDAGPQGIIGATGSKGDVGAQGPTGLTGPTGATGLQGPKGDAGATGLTGIAGAQGIKGDTGAVGPQGATGLQGPAGTNATTTSPVSASANGLMTPAMLAQLKNVLSPFVSFDSPAVVTLGVGGPTIIAGIRADRAMQVTGFSFAVPITAGTSLTMTFSLMLNGSSVPNSSATATISAAAGTVTLTSPVGLNAGDRIEISRNVAVAVGVSTGITYGNFQLNYA